MELPMGNGEQNAALAQSEVIVTERALRERQLRNALVAFDEEPVVVPIARFSLGEDVETPDTDLVWELVGEAASAMQGPFDDVFVRHYDVQFTFDVRKSLRDFRANQNSRSSGDGDELFEAEECRRVLLIDELVDRFATDAGFSLADLREAVFEADDIDDAISPSDGSRHSPGSSASARFRCSSRGHAKTS